MSQEKSSTRIHLKPVFPYVRPYRRTMFWMIAAGIFVSLIDAVYPLFNRYALDHFIAQGTLDTVPQFIILYVAVLAAQVLTNFWSTYACGRVEMSIDRDLRSASFNHLQELSFSYFNQNNVGYIHARVMSDTSRIGELFAWSLMELVWCGSYIAAVLVVMFIVEPRLAVYLAVLVPAGGVLIWIFQKKLITLNRKIREINSKITGDLNEGITGVRSIKTLVIEDRMTEDFQADTAEMEKMSVRTTHYSALLNALVTFLGSAALAVVLGRGGQLTMHNMMLIGTLSVFMNYAVGIMDPLMGIIESISSIISVQVNIERFDKLMHTQPDVADPPEVVAKYGDAFHPKKENWEPLIGDVEFRDVSFKYPDGEDMVLEHFNLVVPHGTNVAIVGETGAGKSTLVNLVCRFYEPTEGQVLIDGRDARERSQLWLHSNIGYVLQAPHLFSGTVRENLKYGKPEATDEEIWHALDLVHARGAVEKMEKGLDSEVGEGGDLLSTGEKQLLSFARALLADPRILVLDEATSSIDTETEQAIQHAIATVIAGRTSFVVAHRLSTIVHADVILVVKDGKIVEHGTHKELMRQKGYYYALYTRQFADLAPDFA
jgi:ATP-binding cassette subfamily B protein